MGYRRNIIVEHFLQNIPKLMMISINSFKEEGIDTMVEIGGKVTQNGPRLENLGGYSSVILEQLGERERTVRPY